MSGSPDFPVLVFDPKLSAAEGKTIFRLAQDYIYQWEKDGKTYRIVVPAGYPTDKASVPQIAWSLGFRPDGAHEGAAVIHDFLYQHKGEPPAGSYQILDEGVWRNVPNVWERREMDRLFGRMMREAGVSPIRRKAMYWAVRAFGWISYHFR